MREIFGGKNRRLDDELTGSFLDYCLAREDWNESSGAGAASGALPVAAAAQEPHDLPGGLILPLGEQTTSGGRQGERSVRGPDPPCG